MQGGRGGGGSGGVHVPRGGHRAHRQHGSLQGARRQEAGQAQGCRTNSCTVGLHSKARGRLLAAGVARGIWSSPQGLSTGAEVVGKRGRTGRTVHPAHRAHETGQRQDDNPRKAPAFPPPPLTTHPLTR